MMREGKRKSRYLVRKSYRLFYWYVKIGSCPSRDPKNRGLLTGWYCSEGADQPMIRRKGAMARACVTLMGCELLTRRLKSIGSVEF
jgi:hypothetical protein